MYYVYVIGDTNQIESQNYSNCYIGVTKNLYGRWQAHTRSGYTVCDAILQNSWTFENNMGVLFSGDEESCFDMEAKLRPFPLMGLNEAVGGKGGKTKYSKERNEKISKALTGRVRSEEHKRNISSAKIGKYIGANNPRAVSWKLVDPLGVEYNVCGNLQQFCEECGICWSALRANVGKVVGDISPKFRDTGNIQKRINTIGWTLFKEN